MPVHLHRQEQRHQDYPPTDAETSGEETGGEADQYEFPGLDRRHLCHQATLDALRPGFAPP
jgi:hypothetical protein